VVDNSYFYVYNSYQQSATKTKEKATMLDQLIVKQQENHLSNRDFAHQLGITRVYWIMLKSGRRHMGLKVISAAARRFPELRPAAEVALGLSDEINRA
jgi:hypothetical protein